MNEYKAEVKSGMWEITTFLERAESIFDTAILATPTGEVRNKFCDLNIERMLLIENTKEIVDYAKKLRGLLDKLVVNRAKLDMMSSPGNMEVLQDRDILVTEIVELLKV